MSNLTVSPSRLERGIAAILLAALVIGCLLVLRRQLVSLERREAQGPHRPNGMHGCVYEERLWSRMKEIDGLLECIEENWGCLYGEAALACARMDGEPLLPSGW